MIPKTRSQHWRAKIEGNKQRDGGLGFFESALAFMAEYGIKSFLIVQSLNQSEKAYGRNSSILDNCHVRVSFAINDERTAKFTWDSRSFRRRPDQC